MLDAFSFDFYEMNIQTGQTRKWVLLPLHFSVSPQIKSLFNLSYNLTIVLKHFMEKRFKDLFIRLLAFSVSKCNAFIEKEAVTSCRLHHFLGNLTYSIYFLLFFPHLYLWRTVFFPSSNFWLVFSKSAFMFLCKFHCFERTL